MLIGKKIKRARIKAGMRQRDLARKLQCPSQRITALEHSESITTRTLEKVADALGMGVCDLWSLNEKEDENAVQKPA